MSRIKKWIRKFLGIKTVEIKYYDLACDKVLLVLTVDGIEFARKETYS
jgi:hypothetical protein